MNVGFFQTGLVGRPTTKSLRRRMNPTGDEGSMARQGHAWLRLFYRFNADGERHYAVNMIGNNGGGGGRWCWVTNVRTFLFFIGNIRGRFVCLKCLY